MVYQSIVCCAAFLSLCSMLDQISQKITQTIRSSTSTIMPRSPKPLYRWIQITDEQEKNNICLHACNSVVKEGRSMSPDGGKLITLTRYDLTTATSYYHMALKDTVTHLSLFSEEFEHEQIPILFFTPHNKLAIKLGTIINIWDIPKTPLPNKTSALSLSE
ncbi:MAG: hypothetical protein P4L31_06540 [Candidatus Babeliales bacterium]|nr:hypothetical protein [Candidatus Babeliales bacterium]